MNVYVQENSDYPEIYEVTRVLGFLNDEIETEDGDDCQFIVSLESPQYIITLTSSFMQYKAFVQPEDSDDDDDGLYNDWLEESESVYRRILNDMMKNNGVYLAKEHLECPLPVIILSEDKHGDFWSIDIETR